jgi:ferric-dicitrate binding protein FerR (iron transport regulator)
VDSGFEATPDATLDVRTPFGLIREIGTQFEVRLDDESVRVRLREGAVIVHGADRKHEVHAGSELTVNRDGSVVRGTIPTYGPEWNWLVGVTPMPDLEGRSARAFLEWVARERGWTLAFADEAVARAAGEVVLGGTVQGLTLDEALDAVLPTCRMSYRIERGVLVIAAMPAPGGAA